MSVKIFSKEQNKWIIFPGTVGAPGKSAYQVAVDGGYQGTEEEYNNALQKVPDLVNNVDEYPTKLSARLVKSGGVYQFVIDNNTSFTTRIDELTDRVSDLENKVFTIQIVDELPTASVEYTNSIFLVRQPDNSEYIEYICIAEDLSYKWEKIGTTDVNLDNYYTKKEVDDLIETVKSEFPVQQEIQVVESGNGDIVTNIQYEDYKLSVTKSDTTVAEITEAIGSFPPIIEQNSTDIQELKTTTSDLDTKVTEVQTTLSQHIEDTSTQLTSINEELNQKVYIDDFNPVKEVANSINVVSGDSIIKVSEQDKTWTVTHDNTNGNQHVPIISEEDINKHLVASKLEDGSFVSIWQTIDLTVADLTNTNQISAGYVYNNDQENITIDTFNNFTNTESAAIILSSKIIQFTNCIKLKDLPTSIAENEHICYCICFIPKTSAAGTVIINGAIYTA